MILAVIFMFQWYIEHMFMMMCAVIMSCVVSALHELQRQLSGLSDGTLSDASDPMSDPTMEKSPKPR